MFAEKDEGSVVVVFFFFFFLQEVRKLRGKGERGLVEFAGTQQELQGEGEGGWRTMNARPGVVLRGEPVWAVWLMPGFYIPVEELAGALVDLAVCEGGGGGGAAGMFVENGELRRQGREGH